MKKKEMFGRVETITVKKALDFRAKSNPDNRDIKKGNIERLKRVIEKGDFMLTHQGIAFDTDGMLVNGHHRLHAIIDTGKPVKMFVVYNEPKGTYPYLDIHEKRKAEDLAKQMGERYNNFLGAITKRAYFGMKSTKTLTNKEQVDLVIAHREMAEFIESKMSGTKIPNVTRSGVTGAILRFAYNAPKPLVSAVISALVSKSPSKHTSYDLSAIKVLRDFLTEFNPETREYKIKYGGGSLVNELYRYTTFALNQVMERNEVSKLKHCEKEHFNFPPKIEKKHRKIFG